MRVSRESIVFLLGLMVLFTPRLGIPEDWKMYVLSGAGILLIILGYIMRRAAYLRSIEMSDGTRATDSFVESTKKIQFPDKESE